MEFTKKCKWCSKLITLDSNNMVGLGYKIDFCSEECNEEFYYRYRCGFIPRKYINLPYIELSDKLTLEMLNRTKIFN